MAFQAQETSSEHTTVAAGTDLRSLQYLAVQVTDNGVLLAVTDTGSGKQFVLMNKPDSGDNAEIWGAPNVAKARAGLAVTIGNWVTANGSAHLIQTSAANDLACGVALETVSSGELFACRLV